MTFTNAEIVQLNLEQGSPEWLAAKLAVISASRVYDILPGARGYRASRETYMLELLGQIATREYDEVNAKALEWGKQNEAAARAAFEFETGTTVNEAGFIYGKDKRIGCSPDGLLVGAREGLEIKCPMTAKVHMDFLLNDEIKPEYIAQIQFSLWITGLHRWHFCSFHSKFKSNMIKIKTFEADPKYFEMFEKEIPLFTAEMDQALGKLGLKFGDQWS
jgi:putative phage-type endonuclease